MTSSDQKNLNNARFKRIKDLYVYCRENMIRQKLKSSTYSYNLFITLEHSIKYNYSIAAFINNIRRILQTYGEFNNLLSCANKLKTIQIVNNTPTYSGSPTE